MPSTDPGLNREVDFLSTALKGRVGAFASNPWLNAVLGRVADEFAALPASRQQTMPFFNDARQRIGLF
jgi:hypothetical protein